MSSPIDSAQTDLSTWFSKQPVWVQYAAAHLLEGKSLNSDQITELANAAIKAAKGELPAPPQPLQLASLGVLNGGSVKLKAIGNVSGVGQLKPKNPLSFGGEKLAVVFGSNGSGKSSYVRILKHACGARHKGEIHANVFDSNSAPQSSSITFSDAAGDRSIDWNQASGVVKELSTVDIFDTHCGHSYLASEGQSTYEPRLLGFLSELAALCDQVAAKLSSAISAKTTALPQLPPEHVSTVSGKWYTTLTAKTAQTAIDANCTWIETDEEELGILAKYLAERSPSIRAKELEVKKGFVDGLSSSFQEHCTAYSDSACRSLMTLRKTAREKQQTAELAAKVNLQEAILEGVGTKQWLALWSIAKLYSVEVAYPDNTFPHTGDGSRCVLCHQDLTAEAARRIQSFEQYVANEAATSAKSAKLELEKAIEMLPALPDGETIEAKCTSAGLGDESIELLKQLYKQLDARRALILADDIIDEFGEFPDSIDWNATADAASKDYAAQAKQFLEGYSEQERIAKTARQKELTARKWIHSQKGSVETEVKRLVQVGIWEKAKDLCGTRAISLKKGALAEELITPAYIASFNAELKRLGARRIHVELVKTQVKRGAIMHQVKLRDAAHNKPIQDVLSEGEHRIVCIAAFLADVASKPNGSTFVFDDPISSLDLDFEESVVQRLVNLSANRQVIIFTHRLSLLGMVQDYAKKAGTEIRVVHIRKEPWGAGEPGDEAIDAAKPKAVLNELLPKRIAAAKAILEHDGEVAYRVHAQSICTETRKLVERMIELELLGDVIQRHRRAINTQGKLDKLADITPEDCAFIDEMMTKYSRYEHAQSLEAPVDPPQPDELMEDIANMKKWRDDLEKRRK